VTALSTEAHKAVNSVTTAATPGGDELLVKLKPVFRVSGNVTDARTHQPIKSFTYVQGVMDNNGKQRFLYRNYQQKIESDQGRYDRVFPAPHSPQERERDTQQWYVRIEADGHLPQESRLFDEGEGPLTFDFALEPAEPITGTIVDVDGNPLPDVPVLLATPTQEVEIQNGRIPTGGGPDRSLYVKTDAQGRFAHRPQNEPFELIAIHDSGFARVNAQQLVAAKTRLILQPWGRIEGNVTRDGKPAPRQT